MAITKKDGIGACGSAEEKMASAADPSSGQIPDRNPGMERLLFWAGRLFLTALAVGGLLVMLKLALVAQSFLDSTRSQTPSPIYSNSRQGSSGNKAYVAAPWPEFPHSSPRQVRTSVLNGVRTVSEGWTTLAPAPDVLAYYREQMLSRGWRDVTEETYGLQPEGHLTLNRSDAESYADNYRKIMDSTLVLSSGQWTMHIVAAASQGRLENRVVIYAVEAASLKDFTDSLQATLSPNADKPLEALQHSAGQSYRTTMAAKDEPTAQAFREELGALEAEGWHSLVLLPNQPGRPGPFAWLGKGEAYLALSASPVGEGRCTITRTQVTPDSAKTGQ